MDKNTLKGAIYGFAYGDAWGKDTEFMSFEDIVRNLYPHPFPRRAYVTDDTQMSLYAMYAVSAAGTDMLTGLQNDEVKRNRVRVIFADSFVEFAGDPDNNRAPGTTCMKALGDYSFHREIHDDTSTMTGMEGVVENSKGCGANMRCGWFGLLPLEEDDIINLAIIQSETTHGHPLALSSSVMTALTLRAVVTGEIAPRQGLYFRWALDKVAALQEKLSTEETPAGGWSEQYATGLQMLAEFLVSKEANVRAFIGAKETEDICKFFGEGWVAEEAYLCALMGADYSPLDPVEGLERLVCSNGDSDSLAAIGGQFIGAFDGFNSFPSYWEISVEPRYRVELQGMVDYFLRIGK